VRCEYTSLCSKREESGTQEEKRRIRTVCDDGVHDIILFVNMYVLVYNVSM